MQKLFLIGSLFFFWFFEVVTPCQVQLGQAQRYLEDAEEFLNKQQKNRDRLSNLRLLRYVRRLYLCAYAQRDYRSIIGLIEELRILQAAVLSYKHSARDFDATVLDEDVSIVIENLENLDASQDEKVISRYQELVYDCYTFFEKLPEILGTSEHPEVMKLMNEGSDKIECFRASLTPNTVLQVVDTLRLLPDAVLKGAEKRRCKKVVQFLVAELLNLSFA